MRRIEEATRQDLDGLEDESHCPTGRHDRCVVNPQHLCVAEGEMGIGLGVAERACLLIKRPTLHSTNHLLELNLNFSVVLEKRFEEGANQA